MGGNIYHSVQTLRSNAGLNPVLVGGYVDIHRVSFWYKSYHEFSGTLRLYMEGVMSELYPNNLGEYEFVEVTFSPPERFVYPANYIIQFAQWGGTSGWQYIDNITIDFDANVT
jgi:hypothetical protein